MSVCLPWLRASMPAWRRTDCLHDRGLRQTSAAVWWAARYLKHGATRFPKVYLKTLLLLLQLLKVFDTLQACKHALELSVHEHRGQLLNIVHIKTVLGLHLLRFL